jgi:hypothetical protein
MLTKKQKAYVCVCIYIYMQKRKRKRVETSHISVGYLAPKGKWLELVMIIVIII